jgi:hypothetical protein
VSLSYDAIVDGLVRQGVPRAAAERRARDEIGFSPEQRAAEERRENVLEKEEQYEIRKLLMAFGFHVYNLSQARAAKQTPGLPDLWNVHRTLPIAFWWETKRQVGGELSEPQEDFRDECHRCHVGHGTGDRYAVAEHLRQLDLAELGTVYPPQIKRP